MFARNLGWVFMLDRARFLISLESSYEVLKAFLIEKKKIQSETVAPLPNFSHLMSQPVLGDCVLTVSKHIPFNQDWTCFCKSLELAESFKTVPFVVGQCIYQQL